MTKRSGVSKFFRKLFRIKPNKQEQKEMAMLLSIDIQTVLKKIENDTKIIDFTIQDILKKAKVAKEQNNTTELNATKRQFRRKKGERIFLNNIHERLSKELEDLQNSGSLIQIESVLNSIRGLRSGFMSNTEYFDRNQQTALKKINSYLLNAETISEDRLKSGDSFIDFIDENFENQLTDEAIEKDLGQAVTPSKLKNPIKEKL
jgi:hypothetical protein